MELESVSDTSSWLTSIESDLQFSLALSGGNQRQINLLGDELECSINLVLAPASHVASDTRSITEDVVELIVTRWQAGGVDIWVVQVNISVSIEEGNVIAESSSSKLWVLENPDNCVLLMVESFRRVETTSIPFSNSNFQ